MLYPVSNKRRLTTIEMVFLLSILLCVYYFPIRFGLHDYFMVTPMIGLFLFVFFLIKCNFSYKLNSFDFIVLVFLIIVIKSFFVSSINGSIVDAIKGFRIYGVPIFYYFLLRMILRRNIYFALTIDKFIFYLLLSVLCINLYMSVDHTLFMNTTPSWYISTGRGTEHYGNRSPGILADPHSSGLLSVCAVLYILTSYKLFLKTKVLQYITIVLCMLAYFFATYRTAIVSGVLAYILLFIAKGKISRVTLSHAIITLPLLLLLLFLFVSLIIYPNFPHMENYLNVFFFWITDTEKLLSASDHTIFSSISLISQDLLYSPIEALVGTGFPSSENSIVKLNTNDQGYMDIMNGIGFLGVLSLLSIPYVAFAKLRPKLLKYYKREYVVPYCLIVLTIIISTAHSPMYMYHGITHVYYLSLAILVSRWVVLAVR